MTCWNATLDGLPHRCWLHPPQFLSEIVHAIVGLAACFQVRRCAEYACGLASLGLCDPTIARQCEDAALILKAHAAIASLQLLPNVRHLIWVNVLNGLLLDFWCKAAQEPHDIHELSVGTHGIHALAVTEEACSVAMRRLRCSTGAIAREDAGLRWCTVVRVGWSPGA